MTYDSRRHKLRPSPNRTISILISDAEYFLRGIRWVYGHGEIDARWFRMVVGYALYELLMCACKLPALH